MTASTASTTKCKILLFGSIGSETEAFLKKLRALHGSRAGPFDAAFSVGPCVLGSSLLQADLPVPVYLQEASFSGDLPILNHTSEKDESAETKRPIQVGPNLYLLREFPKAADTTADTPNADTANVDTANADTASASIVKASDDAIGGIWSLKMDHKKPPLVVVSCPSHFLRDSASSKPLLEHLQHVSFTGCDLLLSAEWPQGVHATLESSSTTATAATSSAAAWESYDLARVALVASARYHVVPGPSFQQSAPFDHAQAVTSTAASTAHVGRFLALAQVTPTKTSSTGKFVHALGLVPLHHSSRADLLAQRPDRVLPNPFTDESYQAVVHGSMAASSLKTTTMTNNGTTGGLSEAAARRLVAQDRQRDVQRGGTMRWAQKRSRDNDHDDQVEVDPTNTTLFCHGLHQDVTGQLQLSATGDALLQQAFQPYGMQQIRRPAQGANNTTTTAFLFLEFASHEAAAQCLEDTAGRITVHGVDLQLKWGTTGNKRSKQDSERRFHRLTQAEAKDSTSLYYKLVGLSNTGTTESALLSESDLAAMGESLRKWMEFVLENALNDAESTERVTAADEPALAVQIRHPAHFGFLDFASHAAASMALATVTGSTDGGRVLPDVEGHPTLPESVTGLYFHWATPKPDAEKDVIQDAETGFSFTRQHFPADARKDCWFCLASESCEKHLITSVHDTCYTAMPKGPVHPGHVLLVPVQHDSAGALMDPTVAAEMQHLKDKLRHHAAVQYNHADLFCFERAIQTKGGYHTHVQCIPVAKKWGLALETCLTAQAKRAGMDLRQLQSDVGLQALLTDCDGYFYAELSVGQELKRFLYKADGSAFVPLQFGREVLAAVMGKPDLAHWKSCVVDKEQETQLALDLRESMAKMDDAA